jgi:hypothetical protein
MQFLNRESMRMNANSRPFVSIRGFRGAPFWYWLGQVRNSDFGFLSALGFRISGFTLAHA